MEVTNIERCTLKEEKQRVISIGGSRLFYKALFLLKDV